MAASYKPKHITLSENDDAHGESKYSAVHYDSNLVMRLVKETVAQKGAGQRYILLEGFFNANLLKKSQDQLALRAMDELFSIEKELGEVAGIVSLQTSVESNEFSPE